MTEATQYPTDTKTHERTTDTPRACGAPTPTGHGIGLLAGGVAAGLGGAVVLGETWLIPLSVILAVVFGRQRSREVAPAARCAALLRPFVRAGGAWIVRRLYRLDVRGLEHIPSGGGALLVCNHVSYMDACLVQTPLRRLIGFLMYRRFFHHPLLHPLCRTMQAIPIATDDSSRDLRRSLRTASRRVAAGDLVCIFAEGGITRNGSLLRFTRGLELIVRDTDAPIIPVHIQVEPGSFSTFRNGRPVWRLPFPRRLHASIAFGNPMPARTEAWEVREAVAELGAETACRTASSRSLAERFLHTARRHPGRFCMSDETGMELSYGAACVKALSLARALRRRLPSGEPVGILLPTSIPAALTNVALALLGIPTVNLNYTAGLETVNHAGRKSGMNHLITSRRFLEHLGWEPDGLNILDLEDLKADTTWKDAVPAVADFILARKPSCLRKSRPRDRREHAGELATILFSSGSTGTPKGVMLSHTNLNANISAMMQVCGLTQEDRLLGCLPFFHCFGLTATLWLPLSRGMGTVYQRNPLDFKTSGRLVHRHGVSVLLSTPTFLTGYIRRCTPEQMASIRHVAVGAEKLTDRLREAFEKRFGVSPREGYGATELAPFASANVPDVDVGNRTQVGTRKGTVGRPLPNTAARIVNPENGKPCRPNQNGMLLVKGPGVMMGYIGDPGQTARTIRNGWYRTGDLASIDEEGFITIHDRLSRFSKIGGEMVPHLNIETAINDILGTNTPQNCVVTGVPDPKKGERLVVIHKPALNPESVVRELRGRDLPNLWIPHPNAFVQVDDIPILGTGKLDLCRIRKLARKVA